MFKFKDWLQFHENAIEQEIINIHSNNPNLRANKIASIMRNKGYSLGYTQIANTIKKWHTGLNKPNDLWVKTSDKKLNKKILDIARVNPNSTPEQVVDILRGMSIFAEPWQVKSIMTQNKIMPQNKIIPSQIDEPIDSSSVYTYFGNTGGGGSRIRKSPRYN